jgi:flagellar biosynthetic protein FliR
MDIFDIGLFDETFVTLFFYVAARMSGFVIFNPIFGRSNIPTIFRSGMVIVLTLFTLFTTSLDSVIIPTGVLELILRVALELGLGFVLGIVVNFFFYIPQLAGFMVDLQMGMTMNQIYDAGAEANLSVTGEVLNILMLLLFFAANGHHTLMRIILTSGDIVAFGAVSLGTNLVNRVLELFIQCTVLAVKVCMPILAAELLGQLGMGVLMKAIPQINVFSINIELKVIIGLVLLLLLISPYSEFFLQIEMDMLNTLEELLSLAAA